MQRLHTQYNTLYLSKIIFLNNTHIHPYSVSIQCWPPKQFSPHVFGSPTPTRPISQPPSHSIPPIVSYSFLSASALLSLTPAALYPATPLAWWRWTPLCCRSPGSSPCSWGSPFPGLSPGHGSWMLTLLPRSPRHLWVWSSGSVVCRTSCRSTFRQI